MKFCSVCGGKVEEKVPEGDNRPRFVCTECGEIHYQNPTPVVCAIPLYVDNGVPKIMLCKRNIEPRINFWTIPGGFLENGETMAEGAARETVEESCAEVQELKMFRAYDVIHAHQIQMIFRSVMKEPKFQTTEESIEVRLFEFHEIPWRQLSFPPVQMALRDFVECYSADSEGDCPEVWGVKTTIVGRSSWTDLDRDPE